MDRTITHATIKYRPNKEGIEFYVEGINVQLDDLSSLDSHLSKRDSVSAHLLHQLVDYEQCEVTEAGMLVPYSTVAGLEIEQIETLGLPEAFPFDIEIKSTGNLGSKDFKYDYIFLNGASQPFVCPTRLGAYIEITTEQNYLLLGDQFHLVEAMDEFNSVPPEQKAFRTNLLKFSKIRGLAKETGATLDNYLESEEVIAPSKLSLRLRRIDKETIEIEPVFCEEISDESKGTLSEEPSNSQDELLYNKSLLNEGESKRFLNVFDRRKELDVYAISGGPRVVLDEEQKKALGSIKRNRQVKGKEIETLLNNPEEFFDLDIIDLDNPLKEGDKSLSWSERVIEIGEYKPRVFAFLRPNKEPWIPPEGGIIINGVNIYISSEETEQFKHLLEVAKQSGKREILWKGESVPVDENVIDAIRALHEEREKQTQGGKVRRDTVENENNKISPNVLIIKDNFDDPDHGASSSVRSGNIVPPTCLTEGKKLLPHQAEGLTWLQNLWIKGAKGGILADDMGLGKTLQALVFMGWVHELLSKERTNNKPMLIVAPVVLLKNWRAEYEEFLDPVFGKFLELHGQGLKELKDRGLASSLEIVKEIDIKDRVDAKQILSSGRGLLLNHKKLKEARVVLTTYETIRDYQFSLGLIKWSVIILDETQKIKSPTAMVTLAVKAMQYEFGLSLTGTPVENSWIDLWSIMDFVQPGHLGSLKEFAKEFHNPLGRADANERKKLGEDLKTKVDPYLKRRMKEDHLDGLPDKILEVHKVKMPDIQFNRYLEVIRKARETSTNDIELNKKPHILQTIAQLRDISLHPDLPFVSDVGFSDFEDEDIINRSARLKKTIELLDEIKSKEEKAIVFIVNRKMQGILQRILAGRYSIKVYKINGTVPGAKRKSFIDSFQQTLGFNVIILSPEAAGVGLNITAVNHVIHLGRAWNPAKEDQATDRVYRIGQDKTVHVHLPLAVHPYFDNEECRGTFDLKLHNLLDCKRHLSRSLLMPTVISEGDWDEIVSETVGPSTKEPTRATLNIKDIDRMEPIVFEKAVAAIYRQIGHQVELTPITKDQGADVVALPHREIKGSFLIQCKHTIDPAKTQGGNGVQEINAAYGIYSKDYDLNFEKVVITNAERFTSGAQQLANANNVRLIQRKELFDLLESYPIMTTDL